jgi:hypothetical protein
MDENVSKSPDRGENAANKVAPSAASESAPESQASDSKLRVLWCDSKLRDLWSPKLNLGEGVADDCARAVAGERITASSADTAQGASREAVARPASDAPLPRSLRLAAPVAAAAVLGAFVGSLSTGGVARFWPGIVSNVVASGGTQAIKAELAELSALKTNLEGATRNLNSQFARLAERLDRIERAEAEPNAKLAHIVEAVDRIEKERKSVMASSARPAAVETTGTIPKSPSAPAEAERPEKVLPDWTLHDVRGSRALVENRRGDIFEITGGSMLPGLGRVEAIKRQDGDWVVVTVRGIIAPVPSKPSVIPAERVQ